MRNRFLAAFVLLGLAVASCGAHHAGENPQAPAFAMKEVASFDKPWAMEFDRGTGVLFVTEMAGRIRFIAPDGTLGSVSGVPQVDLGGQGGLGDFLFAPGQDSPVLDRRIVYLSWAEAGSGNLRGAAVARALMICETATSCDLRDLQVIWRQQPKTSGRGHYAHRLAFSPDGKYLFIASGDRQLMAPAQDVSNNLGTIVRLMPDGTAAPANPHARLGAPANQIWSHGHRNILGLAFDDQGRLWAVEHGPAGGDELNLIRPGANYGWPLVSQGAHYDGRSIPGHATRPDLAAPAISWNPVIAPGDMIIYKGAMFPEWRGQALIAAMKPAGLVRVAIDGESAREVARHPMPNRIRSIAEGPDGAIWLLEDGRFTDSARLLKLTRADR